MVDHSKWDCPSIRFYNLNDYGDELRNSEMRLVDFIEQALLKSIGSTRALIIIEATNKDSFATALNSLL